MRAIFGELKEVRTHVQPPIGNYAMEVEQPRDVHWDHCREQFAAKFNETSTGFYFSHQTGKSEDIGEFLTKFEQIVNIKELSVFSKTNKENVLWVQPSKFWTHCYLKRSLLSILLRCGMNYNISLDNFDDALFGEYKESVYVKETRSAILRFMFGFTHWTGVISNSGSSSTVIKHGWREEFLKLDDSTIRRRLVLPEGEARETSIIGVESLWS